MIPDDYKDWEEADYKKFARFINPEKMVWKVSQLIYAWRFISDINNNRITFQSKVPYGFPTPDEPKKLSPLLCYAICSRISPSVNLRGRTMEEMYTVSRAMLFSDTITGLVDTLQQSLYLSLATTTSIKPLIFLMNTFDDATDLLNTAVKRRLSMSERFSFLRSHINNDINNRIENGFFTLREGPSTVVPPVPEEGHLGHFTSFFTETEVDTDFSRQNNLPFFTATLIGGNLNDFEYGNMYAECLRNRQMVPGLEFGRERVCAIVKAAYFYNRDITDAEDPSQVDEDDLEEYPLLSEDFNPSIPPRAFRNPILAELAFNEGLIENLHTGYNEYELHELLQMNILEPKFWHGLCTPTVNTETLYLDPIEEIQNPISYGVRGGPYYVYDPDELALFFQKNQIFQNPAEVKVSYFAPKSIRQLLQILDEGNLKQTITGIVDKLGTLEMKIQEFYRLFNKKKAFGEQFAKLIWALHEVAMFTRGWDGEGPMPVETAVFDNYNEVEERSNIALGKYLNILEQSDKEVQECFNEIPIWKYFRNQYLRSQHEANTIQKRIQLVLQGEGTGRDEHSCIRLSSNYFAATSFRLAAVVKIDLKYNIEDLREIS